MSRSQSPSLEKQDKIKQRREERQAKRQREQQKLQEAFNQQGNLSKDWMKDLLDTDDLTEELQPNTVNKIQGLLNKQWIIANLNEAETHDKSTWLEVMKHRIYGEHPPSESRVQGPIRAVVMDDETEYLMALSASERNTIDQIIKSLQNMVTRSREGFERKQQQTSIAKTEQETQESKDSSGGLFSSPF